MAESAPSPPGRARPLLLAAVVLGATLGFLGGGGTAWALYQRLGPARVVVAGPPANAAGGQPRAVGYGDVAGKVAQSLVEVVTQPLGPADALAVPHGIAVGFVAGPGGLVVTTAHAVAGATRLRLAYPDGHLVEAGIAAIDAVHGLVVLQAAQAPTVPVLPFADPSSPPPRPGDAALAIGRAPLGSLSVTAGTIRATGLEIPSERSPAGVVDDVLAVDAAADPADDGAPLVDATGNVIGVVVAPPPGAPPGLLALSGRAAGVLVDRAARGLGTPPVGFGIAAVVLDATSAAAFGLPPGALVRAVLPGGPGDVAGLRPGDVVTAVDGTPIDAAHPLDAVALGIGPGTQVTLTVDRLGTTLSLRLTVG